MAGRARGLGGSNAGGWQPQGPAWWARCKVRGSAGAPCVLHARRACHASAPPRQVDAASLAGIRRAYGDFLYAKRDYEGAMEQ